MHACLIMYFLEKKWKLKIYFLSYRYNRFTDLDLGQASIPFWIKICGENTGKFKKSDFLWENKGNVKNQNFLIKYGEIPNSGKFQNTGISKNQNFPIKYGEKLKRNARKNTRDFKIKNFKIKNFLANNTRNFKIINFRWKYGELWKLKFPPWESMGNFKI